MPGLTGRMSTIVKAKVSKVLDRAEDPAETLDYSYSKQLELLQNVKKGIADVVTSKKRLQLQEAQMQQQVVKLDTQARQALAANREDLARMALERKQGVQTELQSLDSQIAELEDQQQKLTDSEAAMRAKLEAFRTKKEVIKAQYSAAEAQVRISEAATGVGEQMADVGLAMQRALDKTENMKARAAAVGELEAAGTFDDLTQLGPGKDDIDRQLEAIGAGGAVDDELAKMKAELGSGAPAQHGARGRLRRAMPRHAGPGARRRRAGRDIAVIVRIFSDGQYRVPADAQERLHELDNADRRGGRRQDEAAFKASYAALIELHPRERASASPTTTLEPSDLMLPAGRHHARGGAHRVHRRGPAAGLTQALRRERPTAGTNARARARSAARRRSGPSAAARARCCAACRPAAGTNGYQLPRLKL